MTISVSKVYPSKWISPEDVSRAFTLIVTGATVEEFRLPDGSKEHKIVLAFARATKRLPLNKTQAKTLAHLLGDDAEQWKGKTIILAPATAPNHKPTIAVSIPQQPGASADLRATAPGDDNPDEPCETCGQAGGHHPECPEA